MSSNPVKGHRGRPIFLPVVCPGCEQRTLATARSDSHVTILCLGVNGSRSCGWRGPRWCFYTPRAKALLHAI